MLFLTKYICCSEITYILDLSIFESPVTRDIFEKGILYYVSEKFYDADRTCWFIAKDARINKSFESSWITTNLVYIKPDDRANKITITLF